MAQDQQRRGRKGGSSTQSQSSGKGRGWHGDSEGHARAGAMSSGNRTGNRGRSNR